MTREPAYRTVPSREARTRLDGVTFIEQSHRVLSPS
jgi:hypothetical protein